jgi:hypothetical protein
MEASIYYGHWGIDVTKRDGEAVHFEYPIGTRGPVNSAETERKAITLFRREGGVPKGPFFYRETL